MPEPSLTPIPVEKESVASDMGMSQEKAAELTPEKPRQRRSKKDA